MMVQVRSLQMDGYLLSCCFQVLLHSAQGSAFYLGGCALVVYGWTIVGLLIEAYGFWLLFCEFFPTVLQFFRQVPILNRLLNLPFVKTVRETGHV